MFDVIEPAALYSALESVSKKPSPFSVYTAKELWTDEYTSERMLAFHLDGESDFSSRRKSFIDDSVHWLSEHFELSENSRVIDFGCGPGLYTSRLARLGLSVTGIDFSSRSIAYAIEYAEKENLDVTYVEADYLDIHPKGNFDLIMMIMCDFCALSSTQRRKMLAKFEGLLSDRGHIVLDVHSMNAFADKREGLICEKDQLGGFWSPNPYYGFVASFKYDGEKVSVDKYTIVERHEIREIYNWLQYFTPESLTQEAHDAGLKVDQLYRDVSGTPYDAKAGEFAVVLKRR